MNKTALCDIDCNVKETDSIISEGVMEINIVDNCVSETSKIALSVNKSNLSPTTIEESWSKHLFWPKPDTKKKLNRSQLQLPFAVTAIKWREYHANKEQEKIRKEEELTQKRKRREEIKKEKCLKVAKKPTKKQEPRKSKCTKKFKPRLSITMGSEDDATCIYCKEPYSSSKSCEP